MRRGVFLLLLVIFFITNALAGPGDDSTEVYLKYTLEELLNVKITVASRDEEKANEAPAFTVNYTNSDLQGYGYYTLGDLADITSGYSKDHVLYGEFGFETRGQRAGGFENDRHLMLLDGIPISFGRSNKVFTQYDMPLLNIENVSFLKGPGSALYGVSAFYGVLDLKTRSLQRNGFQSQSKISVGTDDGERRWMNSVNYKDDKGEFKLGLTLYDKEASKSYLGNQRRNWDQDNTFFLNASYGVTSGAFSGLTLGVVSNKRTTGIGGFWSDKNSHNNYLNWSTNVFYAKYNKEVANNLFLTTYGFVNQSVEEGGFQGFPNYTPKGREIFFSDYKRSTINAQGAVELKRKFTNHTLIGGINVDQRSPSLGGNSIDGSFMNGDSLAPQSFSVLTESGDQESITTYSAYIQEKIKLNLLRGLLITVGVRNDYGISKSFAYNQLSPRVGLVQKITRNLNMKLLFGSALRTPNVKIVGLNRETNNKIIDKQPSNDFRADEPVAEVIRSLDFGMNYTTKNFLLEGTVFYNVLEDQIVRRSFTSLGDATTQSDDLKSLNYVANSLGDVTTHGYEVSLKVIPKLGSHLFVNHSFAMAEDKTNDAHEFKFQHIPVSKTNLGAVISLNSSNTLMVSSINKFISSYRETAESNSSESYFSSDFNVIMKPTERLSLEVQLLDAFDSESDEFSEDIIIPSRGRRFLFTLGLTI